MRLFIAVNFPDNVKDGLYDTVRALRENSLSGTFSQRENLHLTLAFLGEVHPRRFNEIKNAMTIPGCAEFDFVLSGFGKFARGGESLYWRGINNCPALKRLQAQLSSNLRSAGFELDSKPFRPHITLARRCVMPPSFREKEFGASLPDITVHVPAISLMRSERIAGRLTYTEMYRAPLNI